MIFRVFLHTKSADNQTVLSPIPPSLLFSGDHLQGSPYDVTVLPSTACASLSLAYIVSVVTVGVSSVFSLQIRDSFLNVRPCETVHWVRFFSMEPIPGSYSLDGLSCLFSFIPSNATVGYTNALVDDTYVLSEASPLVVLSGRLDLYRSAVKVSSSLITAGLPTTFSVTLFDSVNNPKDLRTLYEKVELTLYNSLENSGMKPFGSAALSAIAPPANASEAFYFVVTVSAQYLVSVIFMSAFLARLPLVVVPSAACAASSFMIGDAVSLATNGERSQFHVHLRDSFGNAAALDSSMSLFVHASTYPRFSGASVASAAASSKIPISFIFKHTRTDASANWPQISASLAFVGGLTAT
jgi:hypothetical protein